MSSAAGPADGAAETSATEFVLEDFHRVRSPRLMTEDYFELVSEKYDDLAEETPESDPRA